MMQKTTLLVLGINTFDNEQFINFVIHSFWRASQALAVAFTLRVLSVHCTTVQSVLF